MFKKYSMFKEFGKRDITIERGLERKVVDYWTNAKIM